MKVKVFKFHSYSETQIQEPITKWLEKHPKIVIDRIVQNMGTTIVMIIFFREG